MGPPAGLGEVKVQVQALKAGRHRGLGRQRKLAGPALEYIGHGRVQRPAPTALQTLQHALGLVGLERGQPRRFARQALGQLRQHANVQPVAAELAARQVGSLAGGAHAGARIPQCQARIAAGPADAVCGLELQTLGAVLLAPLQAFDCQAARCLAKHLLRRARAQAHVFEQHVCRHPGQLTALHVHPCTHAALALNEV